MVWYALTIFISAFQLFLVQPLIGKYILPWFGGTPAVWTTCMLFFQLLLLAGYSYAHLIVSRLGRWGQGVLHLVLLGVALVVMAITFPPSAEFWKPTSDGNPTVQILLLLLASVGRAYLLLSSTGPLLQGWFAQTNPGASPYRLYALSNVGSLLALLGYPFLFEPIFELKALAGLWAAGYAVFAVLCGICAWKLLSTAGGNAPAANIEPRPAEPRDNDKGDKKKQAVKAKSGPDAANEAPVRPNVLQILLWLALSACGSAMLLATTNQLCQDVAVVPFLWILPLALYLLTFIICFDNPDWYSRPWFAVTLIVAVYSSVIVLTRGVNLPDAEIDLSAFSSYGKVPISSLKMQMFSYSFMLFISCMVCHGELVQLKPQTRYLTLFYLMVSLGGALGGALVSLVAPRIFLGFWEYHFSLGAICLLLLLVAAYDYLPRLIRSNNNYLRGLAGLGLIITMVSLGVLGHFLRDHIVTTNHGVKVKEITRNFYGVLKVEESSVGHEWHKRNLQHGRINHGYQYLAEDKKNWPTSYYGRDSGIGVAIDHNPRRQETNRGLRIGVVGLGTGTIAAYGEKGDYLRFYDINPEVLRLSDKYFTYRKDAQARGADVAVFMGDARIVMERQIAANESQRFDVLAIDAFSSDAIPVHLLTKECSEIYWQQLKPDGILAIHISNRYLDLAPVTRQLALESNRTALWVDGDSDDMAGTDESSWVLVTNNAAFIGGPAAAKFFKPWPTGYKFRIQTEDGEIEESVLIDNDDEKKAREALEALHPNSTVLKVTPRSKPLASWTDSHSPIWPLFNR